MKCDQSSMQFLRIIIIIIIIRHAPCQCVAPLATNSLHSDLSKACSIASSKVRLCRDRSLFRVTGLLQSLWWTPVRILLASAVSSILATWPNSMSLFFCMIAVRGGCSIIRLTSRLETRWYQRISRILLRHHWSSASIFQKDFTHVRAYSYKYCAISNVAHVNLQTLVSSDLTGERPRCSDSYRYLHQILCNFKKISHWHTLHETFKLYNY